MSQVHALVPAAGLGERLGGDRPKQYLDIAGRSVLQYAVDALGNHPAIARITVLVAPGDNHFESLDFTSGATVDFVAGGATRAESVMNGLNHVDSDCEWTLVHDAARPCLPAECLDRLLETGLAHEVGAILAMPVRDTLKREGATGQIGATVNRDGLWVAQTPQLFRAKALASALSGQLAAGRQPTDEAAAMEAVGLHAALVMGSAINFKITWPEDLALADAWLSGRGKIGS